MRERDFDRFIENRKPSSGPLFQDADKDRPASWYEGFYIGLARLMKELHVGYIPLLRILDEEGITIVRVPIGNEYWCYISPVHLPDLKARHGNPLARKRRMEAWGGNTREAPLNMPCPHCRKRGRLRRKARKTTAGNTVVKCGYCGRSHTLNRRPPLEATCPRCGQTTGQWRAGFSSTGNRYVKCKHCLNNYTLNGDPEYVSPPFRLPSQVEPTPADACRRAADLPSGGELRVHEAALDADARDWYVRMDAELARHSMLTRMREIEDPQRPWYERDPLAPPDVAKIPADVEIRGINTRLVRGRPEAEPETVTYRPHTETDW